MQRGTAGAAAMVFGIARGCAGISDSSSVGTAGFELDLARGLDRDVAGSLAHQILATPIPHAPPDMAAVERVLVDAGYRPTDCELEDDPPYMVVACDVWSGTHGGLAMLTWRSDTDWDDDPELDDYASFLVDHGRFSVDVSMYHRAL
jgi:hypothetical protein